MQEAHSFKEISLVALCIIKHIYKTRENWNEFLMGMLCICNAFVGQNLLIFNVYGIIYSLFKMFSLYFSRVKTPVLSVSL